MLALRPHTPNNHPTPMDTSRDQGVKRSEHGPEVSPSKRQRVEGKIDSLIQQGIQSPTPRLESKKEDNAARINVSNVIQLIHQSKSYLEENKERPIELNENQLIKICEIGRRSLSEYNPSKRTSGFDSIKHSDHPDLPKLHVVCKPLQKRVDIYTKTHAPKKDLKGKSKDFAFALRIILHENGEADGELVARLTALPNPDKDLHSANIHTIETEGTSLKAHSEVPGVCQVLDGPFVYKKGTKCITYQKLYRGNDLLTYLDQNPKSKPKICLPKAFYELLIGLNAIHKKLIHCDLSHLNVFVDTVAPGCELAIGDLGLATPVADPKVTGFSLRSLSPIRWESGGRNFDKVPIPGSIQDDIWALGCVFLSLMTKSIPSWAQLMDICIPAANLAAYLEQKEGKKDNVEIMNKLKSYIEIISDIQVGLIAEINTERTNFHKTIEMLNQQVYKLLSKINEDSEIRIDEVLIGKIRELRDVIQRKLDDTWKAMEGNMANSLYGKDTLLVSVVRHMLNPLKHNVTTADLLKQFGKELEAEFKKP